VSAGDLDTFWNLIIEKDLDALSTTLDMVTAEVDEGTRRAAEMALFEYINGFYNPRRRHSALGWKSSLAVEAQAA